MIKDLLLIETILTERSVQFNFTKKYRSVYFLYQCEPLYLVEHPIYTLK